MTETIAIIVFLASLFLMLGMGVWVGATLLGTAVFGMMIFTSAPVGDSMAINIWAGQSSWTLTALPLFVWMGEILFRTSLSETLFRGLSPFLGRLPGGLLHVNIGASAVFAAISGSSAATVATVGKMAIPELRKRKYPEKMIIGTLSGAGTLGLLIPPSISMIVYGVTVNESISSLFMAAMIPGILLAACFSLYVIVWSKLNAKQVADIEHEKTESSLSKNLMDLLPVLCLIGGVIGSIYSGFATATEAAALGVMGALVLSLVQKKPNLGELCRECDAVGSNDMHDYADSNGGWFPVTYHGLYWHSSSPGSAYFSNGALALYADHFVDGVLHIPWLFPRRLVVDCFDDGRN